MKHSDITFDELRELLLDLGCAATAEKERTTFSHPRLGSFLLLRPYGAKDAVSARDMLVVRRQLVDNGLIEPAAFDHFLDKASA